MTSGQGIIDNRSIIDKMDEIVVCIWISDSFFESIFMFKLFCGVLGEGEVSSPGHEIV